MKVHELKIKMNYFLEVDKGTKTFELRKNDRDFKEGDLVHFLVTFNTIGEGEKEIDGGFYKIDYVLKDVPQYGLKKGYCIFSMHKVTILDWRDKFQRKFVLNSTYGKMMDDYIKKDCACWEDKDEEPK